MKRTLTIPELLLIVSTRVAFGAGIALLLSDRLSRDTRKGAGWALVAVGAVTTIPLALQMKGSWEHREERGKLVA